MIISIYSRRCQTCGEEWISKAKSAEERIYLKALIDAEWANHAFEHYIGSNNESIKSL